MNIKSILVIFIAVFTFLGCGEKKMNNADVIAEPLLRVPEHVWQKLSSKKIFFGHQSVGYNIMEGVRDLITESPMIRLNVLEIKDGMPSSNGGIFAPW